MELALRLLSTCVALAGVEMLHGIVRVRLLVPRLGRARAQRVATFTGCLLAFCVCWLLVPTLGVHGRTPLLAVGLAFSAFMALFDVSVARWLMRRPWASIPEDFDPRRGNFLVFGLAFLVLAPSLVMALRGSP